MSSVIGASFKIAFCEGKSDIQFLSSILRDIPNVLPEQTGGKGAIPSFVKGYMSGRNQTNYIALRDRDLDFLPTDSIALIRTDKNYLFTTHRACLESYWLDPALLHSYLLWRSQLPKYNSRQIVPPSETIIMQHLVLAAQDIAYYQAARWALSDIKRQIGRVGLDDKWVANSGVLPTQLAEIDCVQASKTVVNNFINRANNVSESLFEDVFESYKNTFTAEIFYQSHDFLIWFHGKDLKTAFNRRLTNLSEFQNLNFSFDKYMTDFCDPMLTQLEFDVSKHPDLVELKSLIRDLT